MNKPDGTSRAICAALRIVGASVQQIKSASGGGGTPDLLVGFRGSWYCLELKSPKGVLSPAQRAWHASAGAPVFVCRTIGDALVAIGLTEPF